MRTNRTSDDKAKLLVSAIVAGATSVLAALTWNFLTTGGFRLLDPVAGFLVGGVCSWVYRRRVGVRLRVPAEAGSDGS